MTVKPVVEDTANSRHASVMSALNGKESRFSCPPLEGVFLGAATLLALGCVLWAPVEGTNCYHSSADCLMLCAQCDRIGWSKAKLIKTVFKTVFRMGL